MENSSNPASIIRYKLSLLLILLLGINFYTLSHAASYETKKAIEYYKNGDYKRAKSILTNSNTIYDPTAAYMMGAISLQGRDIGPTSNNIDTAIYWFEISANLKFPQAYHALGRTYEQRWLNNQNLDDYEKSRINYELAITVGINLANSDLSRLTSGAISNIKEEDTHRLNLINKRTTLIENTPQQAQTVPRLEDEEIQGQEEFKNKFPIDDTILAIDNKNESEKSSSNFSVGIGLGIPYGIIGANINYHLNDAFDVTVGAGLGFGAGFRYHPLKNNSKLRLTLFYGDNAGFSHPITGDIETFEGINFGIGYGSLSDGWDFDLIYLVVSDEAKNRITELETQGFTLSSGDTDDAIKISFGYHW